MVFIKLVEVSQNVLSKPRSLLQTFPNKSEVFEKRKKNLKKYFFKFFSFLAFFFALQSIFSFNLNAFVSSISCLSQILSGLVNCFCFSQFFLFIFVKLIFLTNLTKHISELVTLAISKGIATSYYTYFRVNKFLHRIRTCFHMCFTLKDNAVCAC